MTKTYDGLVEFLGSRKVHRGPSTTLFSLSKHKSRLVLAKKVQHLRIWLTHGALVGHCKLGNKIESLVKGDLFISPIEQYFQLSVSLHFAGPNHGADS